MLKTKSMSNVVSLQKIREVRLARGQDLVYQSQIAAMDKVQLLEEMVKFQEERSHKGRLTLEMMVRGQHLFRALERSAETRELRTLTSTYRRHLEHELRDFMQKQGSL